MSQRLFRTTLSQAQLAPEVLPAIGEMVQQVSGVAQKALKTTEEISGEDHRGDLKGESGDFLNELNVTQQSAKEQLAGFGLDSDAYQEYTQQLMADGMPSFMTAAKFIQDVAAASSSAGMTFQDVFPVARNIYRRNIYSPDRAIAIIRVLAKYENMSPGIGIFDMAQQATTGQFNPQALSAVRFSLMGVPGTKGNMNQTRDLQQAFDGINAPNSALGAELNESNLAHQRMQATQESFLIQARLINLMFQKARDAKLAEIMAEWNKNLPTWVRENKYFLQTALQLMNGLAMVNTLKTTAMRGVGVGGNTGLGGNNNAQPAMGFIQTSQIRERKIVVAQTEPGQQPIDLNPPAEPAATVEPIPQQSTINPASQQQAVVNQNINQANQGGTNSVAQQGVLSGVWSTQTANEIMRLQSLIDTQKAALETNYKNLTEMLEVGAQPHSMFAQEFATGTYVTPEQIHYYADTADKNATSLVQLIQSLLTIFVQASTTVSTKSLMENNVGLLQFSANLRNLEANFRAQLKEAQQLRLKIFDISVLGPIDQQVRVLEPTYKKLKSGMEMMAAFNNVGADAYVMPFANVAQQISQLYSQAAQMYRSVISKMQQSEPAMAQYCKSRAEQMEAAAQQAMSEGVVALRNLMKQQSGGTIANTENKFIRIGAENNLQKTLEKNVKDIDEVTKGVEAKPMSVDDYWDDLYDDNPPYGDIMVNPKKHRKQPSWKMHTKKLKRLD